MFATLSRMSYRHPNLVSLFSTGIKYVASKGGQVYTGVVKEVTTKITLTLSSTYANKMVLNKPLHEYLAQQMLAIQEKFPGASVTGIIEGDQYETTYHTHEASDKMVGDVNDGSGGMFS